MNRRGFLAGILAACAAPAIVRADSLMRIVPIETAVLLPEHAQFVVSSISDGISETILTMDQITREALNIAHRKMQMIDSVSPLRDMRVGDVITISGVNVKIGDTLRIRHPNSYKLVGA